MDVGLVQRERGVELSVKASPGARKNEFRGVVDGSLKICVTAIAEKGKANTAIIKFLSKRLGISKSRIELVAGATSSRKKFLLLGSEVEQIAKKLAEEL